MRDCGRGCASRHSVFRILSAANAYLGLFAGLTIATAIPAAVVSMGVLRLLGGGTILENNIVQTGASAGSSIAAGVIFTIPALVILGYWPDFKRRGRRRPRLRKIGGAMKQMERRYVPAMDAQLQRFWLDKYVGLPAGQHVAAMDGWLGGRAAVSVTAAVARLSVTRLGDGGERMKWLRADRAAFEASADPAIGYAVAVMPALLKSRSRTRSRPASSSSSVRSTCRRRPTTGLQ